VAGLDFFGFLCFGHSLLFGSLCRRGFILELWCFVSSSTVGSYTAERKKEWAWTWEHYSDFGRSAPREIPRSERGKIYTLDPELESQLHSLVLLFCILLFSYHEYWVVFFFSVCCFYFICLRWENAL